MEKAGVNNKCGLVSHPKLGADAVFSVMIKV